MQRFCAAAILVCFCLSAAPASGQMTRQQKLLADREKVLADGFWIYNDLAKGLAEANTSGKPLFVILRCVPCEECVKLDDDLVNQDARVRPLLEKFVRVRLVSTNGLGLTLFQFDYDQSFAAFAMNADGTIYGRFGTRSHRTSWSDDVSIDGLAAALSGALELHAHHPRDKTSLAGKRGPTPEFRTPEKHPLLSDKYTSTLNFSGKLVESCIHCHQIGDALRQTYRDRGEPIPIDLLFPYPHPKSIGLMLDPKTSASVARVEEGSPAADSGFQAGDVLKKLGGQPLLSIADVQWVLHRAPTGKTSLDAAVVRDGQERTVTLKLPEGWRQRDNISWRASSWMLRKMVTGGLLLETLSADERQKRDIEPANMALLVQHVGQYGDHAAAHRAGFKQGDVIVEFDGRTDLARETDLMAYAQSARKVGEEVSVTLLRGKDRLTLKLPMQK